MKNKTCLLAIVLLSLSSLAMHGNEIDRDAMEFEQTKIITQIDTRPEEMNYRQDIDALDRFDDNSEDYSLIDFIIDDDEGSSSSVEASPRYGQRLEEEDEISRQIQDFCNQNTLFKQDIKHIWREHRQQCQQRKSDFWPSEVAMKIAYFFGFQGDIENAERFYLLSLNSAHQYEDYIFLELGELFLEYVNDYIHRNRPDAPTPELFYALQKAIHYNALDSGDGGPSSLGEARNIKLKQHRDHMVRWPLSPGNIYHDLYYSPGKLAQSLYGHGYIDRLLRDLDDIKQIWQLSSFNGKADETNILHSLKSRGFVVMRGSYRDFSQYILVNSKGYLVRVKRNPDTKIWEFTVGITLINPFSWNANTNAVHALRPHEINDKDSQFEKDSTTHKLIAYFQENEIVKLAYNNGYVQLVPASFYRRVYGPNGRKPINYWADRSQSNQQMASTHKAINSGDRNNNKGRFIDYRGIDEHCLKID